MIQLLLLYEFEGLEFELDEPESEGGELEPDPEFGLGELQVEGSGPELAETALAPDSEPELMDDILNRLM